jgi:hypothetical protein
MNQTFFALLSEVPSRTECGHEAAEAALPMHFRVDTMNNIVPMHQTINRERFCGVEMGELINRPTSGAELGFL